MDLRLDPLRVDDAAEMAVVLADPALYIVIGGRPPTEPELAGQYRRQVGCRSADGTEEWLNWVIRVDGGAVGYVQASVRTGGPTSIAWVVGTPWQGRGHATAAARLMLAELAGRGVTEVEAYILPGHRPSEAVAEHLGLVPTGQLDDDGEQRWTTPRLTSPRRRPGPGAAPTAPAGAGPAGGAQNPVAGVRRLTRWTRPACWPPPRRHSASS